MIDGKSVLGLITARGGSKSVPRKNVRPLGGKPLIAWSIAAARASRLIDRLILSSDDAEIIATARSYGCEAPFVRPPELATDTARSIDVARHAIGAIETKFDYLALIQPTSPFVSSDDIDGCVRRCIDGKATSCASVRVAAEHPHWMYHLSDRGTLVPVMQGPRPTRRQGAPVVHVLNGAVFVARCDWLLEHADFIDQDTLGYEMSADASIDIDDELDFEAAEASLRARQKTRIA
jgi:CMP-N,N'-diacetyllegionaminic acid synthase